MTAVERGPEHLIVFGDIRGGRFVAPLGIQSPESEDDEMVGRLGTLSRLGEAADIRSRVQSMSISLPRVATVVEDGTVLVEDVAQPTKELWRASADVIAGHCVIWQSENTLLTAGCGSTSLSLCSFSLSSSHPHVKGNSTPKSICLCG